MARRARPGQTAVGISRGAVCLQPKFSALCLIVALGAVAAAAGAAGVQAPTAASPFYGERSLPRAPAGC